MNEDQLKAIIDGQGIDGATIGEWFSGWQRDDLERISRAVQKATVEQLTVSDIAKQIRGTKENDYNDGILATTRVGAVRLARTVINGVCNNARVETIKANSDVIDGIKFVGTLDGKTCPHCASYDGHIWRGEDMASARRPPIHPNCRCTLVPYVELKDEDGNVVDIDNERPAANADFDQLAKDAYNQKAKEKGWKRRFEDLSPSTRLKYYYQAQKDYEKETGKPAYRQVDSNLSFPEYFKQQPDSFKRDWLGAKRYEAYKDGKLTEKAIFAPDLGYTISPSSLVKFVEPEVPEELTKLVKEYEKKGSPKLDELYFSNGDPKYQWIEFHLETPFGIIQGVRGNDEIDLDKLSQSELIEFKRSLLEYWLSNRAKLQNAKPKENDYHDTSHFEDNLAQWELNFQENEKLFTEQKTKLDNRIKKRSKDLTESEILANMYENELQILPLLEKEGRTILPDTIREVHERFEGRSLPFNGIPNSSVDHFVKNKEGKLILSKRRFYDSNGNTEQDFDYDHQNKNDHIFPHVHVWFLNERSLPVRYR